MILQHRALVLLITGYLCSGFIQCAAAADLHCVRRLYHLQIPLEVASFGAAVAGGSIHVQWAPCNIDAAGTTIAAGCR